MKRDLKEAGFSVVELMISAAILAVITAIIVAFLTNSLRVNELNIARSELQGNLNLAMQLITSELFSAGSIGVAMDNSEDICNTRDVNSAAEPAFELNKSAARHHEFTVRYCDSYPREAKKVSYKIQADKTNNNLSTLKRNERGLSNGNFPRGSFQSTIPGIVGLELEFKCKPTDVTGCDPSSGSFNYRDILAITVKIAAQSPFKARNANQDKYYFGLKGSSGALQLKAEKGYLYDYAEQTVHLINLTGTNSEP